MYGLLSNLPSTQPFAMKNTLLLSVLTVFSTLSALGQVDSPFGPMTIPPTICGEGPYGVIYWAEAIDLHQSAPEGFPQNHPQGYMVSLYDAHRITAINGLPEGMTAETDVMASADAESPYGIWYPSVSYGPWPTEWGNASGTVRFDVALPYIESVLNGPAAISLEFHVEHRLAAVWDHTQQVVQPDPEGPYQFGNWYPYGAVNGDGQPTISPISFYVYNHNCLLGTSSTTTPATCEDDSDGSVTISLGDPQFPVEYSVDGGVTSAFSSSASFTISDLPPGQYTIVGKDAARKLFRREFTVGVWEEPAFVEDFCMVTVDEITGKNLLVWEPTDADNIAGYNVYRQSGITSEFELIGTVDSGEDGIFLDNGSNPAQSSDRYAIRTMVIKVCDIEPTEDPLSTTHRTIHLSANIGVNGEVNLLWNGYEGFSYPNFEIQRSTNGSQFFNIGSVANNSYSYSDMFPPQGVNHYRINVVNADGCDPSRVYTSARSNVIDGDGQPVGLSDGPAMLPMSIYPNPSEGIFHFDVESDVTVSVMDAMGREVLRKASSAPHHIDLSANPAGIYTVRVIHGADVAVRRVIRQ